MTGSRAYTKTPKYRAKKTTIDGLTFDSQLEGRRYLQLKAREKSGEIEGLQLQVEFQVSRGMKNRMTGQKIRSSMYIADFVYWDRAQQRYIAEDTKGMETPEFRLKWKLCQSLYPQYEWRKVKKEDM